MLSLVKGLLPVFAAVLVSACAGSSANDAADSKVPPTSLTPQSVAQPPNTNTPYLSASGDQEAVRKVALSLASMSDPASKTYKIGPRDVLEVTVFKAPELSKTIQVSEAGTMNFPLLGELDAAGKSARELEQELTRKLGARYLENPQISVFVKDYFSQRVTIEGAAKKPGVYPIAGGLSLLQLVAQAQGFEDSASSEVVLFRQADGKRLAAKYNVSSIRDGSQEDPQLEAGDVIIVPTSDIKSSMNLVLKLLPLAMFAPYL